MVTDSQAAHVMALVRERHQAARIAFQALLDAYAKGEMDQIVAANEKLIEALRALGSVVASEHHPGWYQDLFSSAERYARKHASGLPIWRAHFDSAVRNAELIDNEDWSFSDDQELLFDIDAIVETARREHRIVELYAKVIDTLEALLNSGDIDSIRAVTDLRRLIGTLQQAKAGSFSAQIFSWGFARRLVSNIIVAYVKRSDITGPLVEAFEQTAQELDVSLEAAKDQIGENILTAAAEAMQSSAPIALTYDLPETPKLESPLKIGKKKGPPLLGG